ncbi:sensor histidine kinase [Nocardioides litoris]|uniref:sensor histidine kinase n=1 Tax=Nocardioides litoris TaxID=1926648 RepID=UPI001FE6A524|nr:HAMP domain-containing sensor histidine kinase [Nocardioides litoris]
MTTGTTTATTERPPRGRAFSVRVRITVTVAVLVAVGLTLAGASVYLIELRRLDDRSMQGAQQELDEFAKQLGTGSAGVGPDLEATLQIFLQRNVPDNDEALIGFVADERLGNGRDARALTLDPAFEAAALPLVRDGGTRRLDDPQRGELLLSSQRATVGGQQGALVVVKYLDIDRADLVDTMRTYVVVALLALLVITAAAFAQAGRLLRPLRDVRTTAEEITETDLSRRLPLTGNDDITALTRTFNGMLDRLEAAFVAQRQLLDDAGHELRTPLTILQGHLELLDAGDPREVDETRTMLLDEVDRMSRLVEDLILLAKTERPGFLATAEVDVAELTESVAAKAGGLGDRHWAVDEAAEVVVPGDPQRLTQALLQLAHNAVKHTRPGDLVALGSATVDHQVLLWVRDTGPGVDPADRDRIFERFGRGARAGEVDPDGFGLGLTIVTGIARAHGGAVWLDDAYADGARFVLSLPLRPTNPPANPPTTPQEV